MGMESGARFVRLLRRYRLLTPEQLRQLDDALLARFPGTAALACEFVRRGWLTEYQFKKLVRGEGRDLVHGPLVVLDRLGSGAMGKVYKVHHRILGRLAALKVVRRSLLADSQAALRFRREVRVIARLDHPHIMRAYGTVQVGDAYGLVTEYVDGESLQALVERQGPLAVEQACDYIRQAALGVEHACSHGVVHRDIKPGNILLTREGVIKVADFGLARLGDGDEPLTRRDAALGTADYIAPEQALDSRTADVRSDLYGLGCTLYFLLTGRPPFPGGSPLAKFMRHRREEARPVQELRPEVPAGVAELLHRLLAKRPEERYQTAPELVQALEALYPGLGRPAPVTPPPAVPAPPALAEPTLDSDFALLRAGTQPEGTGPGSHQSLSYPTMVIAAAVVLGVLSTIIYCW